MAGKSNKGRARRALQNASSSSNSSEPSPAKDNIGTSEPSPAKDNIGTSEPSPAKDNIGASEPASAKDNIGTSEPSPAKDNIGASEPAPAKDNIGTSEPAPAKDNVGTSEPTKADVADVSAVGESTSVDPELKEHETTNAWSQPKQGDLQLYPVSVKTHTGEKLELQLNPGDSIIDIKQFLLDSPETCFITCYVLLLHTKDSSSHHLEDYNEISDVADITTGGCSLEMVPALYDDRSIRAHVHRTRELLSLSMLHASLSTSFALPNEMSQNKAASSGTTDNLKTEVQELDGLGYLEDVSGSMGNLLSSSLKDIKCVESMVFSSFNPPPSYRRLVGDLIYLDVITLEGNKFCITGSTKVFYVNSSTANTLDPRLSKATFEATTLVALLQKISPKFKKAFREILERKAAAHPFENAHCWLPPNSWLGSYPVPDHKRDPARAEDALTLLYGSEPIGMQRDWNEELQSLRELPRTTLQERILRDRAIFKVTSDFVEAAISGAIAVISGCAPPINPMDPEYFHMYVQNEIFFSFAVDADFEQLSRKCEDANSKTLSTNTMHSSSEKASFDSLFGESQIDNEQKDDNSSTEDTINTLETTRDIPLEAQFAESEQATYASANNDLKGTKAYQETDVRGLFTLAMAIIDYRGYRVVAQSILPGILQGDKSDTLLYGSVDNGKKIHWNEDFHSKLLEASKRLHLKEHSVLDGSGNLFKLAAPLECKGIVGSDGRHYLLDMLRLTPRDANYTGPNSRFCILRPELIVAFCQAQAVETAKTRESNPQEAENMTTDSKDVISVDKRETNSVTNGSQNAAGIDMQDSTKEEETGDIKELASAEGSDLHEEIVFNPNVFTEFKLAGSQEEIAADEDRVKKVSLYLTDVVLPKFIHDLCTLEVSPMDGQTLTEALHAHGINIRYIGKVAEGTKRLPHLWDLCTNEIVVRSVKHIIKAMLRDIEDHDIAPAICHFLNCLFGSCQALGGKVTANSSLSRAPKKEHEEHHSSGKHSRGQARWKGRASSRKSQPLYMNISFETLWSDIQEFAIVKYKFELPDDARLRVKKISVLRNLCLKVGITIAAHKYDFNSTSPFQTSDILDLRPVVKHSVPVSAEAKELVEIAKLQLAEGMLTEAYPLFLEAFSILQQVTGPMHREVANCCRYLAMVLYHAGDMDGAIMQQHKELIINERCLGLDHPDTAHSYGNMALFFHGLNQTELALCYMSRALLLLSLSSGPDHPDTAATLVNAAMMYQDVGKMNTALRYLQEALKKNERLLGEEHIQTAVCYHALAIAFNCMGAFKLSHQHEKKTYDILVKQLGEDDSRTRDSQNWVKTFKMRELQMNAQKQKGQTVNATSTQKAIDILKAHPDLIHAFQSAAVAGGSGSSGPASNRSVVGDALPRGRGVDERAQRAAAEVRKKAAARGLLPRQHGVPVQALPPLTQLLNIINSGMTQDAVDSGDAKKGANGIASNDPTMDGKKDESALGQEENAPVGLGKGLASLDAKKQKSKQKPGA